MDISIVVPAIRVPKWKAFYDSIESSCQQIGRAHV